MKLIKSRLQTIIQEELVGVLSEQREAMELQRIYESLLTERSWVGMSSNQVKNAMRRMGITHTGSRWWKDPQNQAKPRALRKARRKYRQYWKARQQRRAEKRARKAQTDMAAAIEPVTGGTSAEELRAKMKKAMSGAESEYRVAPTGDPAHKGQAPKVTKPEPGPEAAAKTAKFDRLLKLKQQKPSPPPSDPSMPDASKAAQIIRKATSTPADVLRKKMKKAMSGAKSEYHVSPKGTPGYKGTKHR